MPLTCVYYVSESIMITGVMLHISYVLGFERKDWNQAQGTQLRSQESSQWGIK